MSDQSKKLVSHGAAIFRMQPVDDDEIKLLSDGWFVSEGDTDPQNEKPQWQTNDAAGKTIETMWIANGSQPIEIVIDGGAINRQVVATFNALEWRSLDGLYGTGLQWDVLLEMADDVYGLLPYMMVGFIFDVEHRTVCAISYCVLLARPQHSDFTEWCQRRQARQSRLFDMCASHIANRNTNTEAFRALAEEKNLDLKHGVCDFKLFDATRDGLILLPDHPIRATNGDPKPTEPIDSWVVTDRVDFSTMGHRIRSLITFGEEENCTFDSIEFKSVEWVPGKGWCATGIVWDDLGRQNLITKHLIVHFLYDGDTGEIYRVQSAFIGESLKDQRRLMVDGVTGSSDEGSYLKPGTVSIATDMPFGQPLVEYTKTITVEQLQVELFMVDMTRFDSEYDWPDGSLSALFGRHIDGTKESLGVCHRNCSYLLPRTGVCELDLLKKNVILKRSHLGDEIPYMRSKLCAALFPTMLAKQGCHSISVSAMEEEGSGAAEQPTERINPKTAFVTAFKNLLEEHDAYLQVVTHQDPDTEITQSDIVAVVGKDSEARHFLSGPGATVDVTSLGMVMLRDEVNDYFGTG